MVNRLLLIGLLVIAGLWLYKDTLDGGRIKALEHDIAVAEAKTKVLEVELALAKSEYNIALANVRSTNAAINLILDKAGKDIDAGLTGVQRLRAIGSSYDAAFTAVRDKCGSAIGGLAAGD